MSQSDPSTTPNYHPPLTSLMAYRQNEIQSLRLLLGQRKLYSRAKAWSLLRAVGIGVIAIVAPLMTVLNAEYSVVLGAIAGVWIFLSRTVFVGFEQKFAAKGAELQEQFDSYVFGMPQLALREPRITIEDLSRLTGDDATVRERARDEKMLDWYPFDSTLDGVNSVAIAQRANAAYAERLLRANASVWLSLTVTWSVISILIGIGFGLKFSSFLLGILFPLLPAFLDVFEQWRTTRQAGGERRALADGIESFVRTPGLRSSQSLLVWQDQLYGLRRKAPQVPNLIYRRTRFKNELAMNAAAESLTAAAKLASPNPGVV
jgi:hypothetical protein